MRAYRMGTERSGRSDVRWDGVVISWRWNWTFEMDHSRHYDARKENGLVGMCGVGFMSEGHGVNEQYIILYLEEYSRIVLVCIDIEGIWRDSYSRKQYLFSSMWQGVDFWA